MPLTLNIPKYRETMDKLVGWLKTQHCYNGVDKVTILEPVDSEIVSQKTLPDNIYQRIVYIMKQSTQEYYNMRMVLGLKCK